MITSHQQTKIKSLVEEIECLKNENSNLKGDLKTQFRVIENLSKSENRPCEDSVTNKYKINVNYKSDDRGHPFSTYAKYSEKLTFLNL